jgi:hypothetical protein
METVGLALVRVNVYKKQSQNILKGPTMEQPNETAELAEFSAKETTMLLYLKEAIKRCGNDDLQFFQTSYTWMFDRVFECTTDVLQYRLHGVVPKYVQEYVKHLQQQPT